MGNAGSATAQWSDNGRPDVISHSSANDTAEAATTILDRDLVNDSIGRIVILVILTDLTECATDPRLDDAQQNENSFPEAAHPDATLSVAVIGAKLAQPSHP